MELEKFLIMKEQIILTIFSLIVSLSALATIGWTTLNGEALYLDGLMLILCCFAAIAIFLPVFLVMIEFELHTGQFMLIVHYLFDVNDVQLN